MRSRDLLGVLVGAALCAAGGLWSLGGVPRHPIAGHQRKVFNYKKNVPAYLEYGRRMRTGFSFQVRAMCSQNADLIKRFKAGEYRQKKDEFEADTTDLCNSLLESIEQFDGQQVPDVMQKSHLKISNCHRLCYESIQVLREAYSAEGAEQQRLVMEAEKKMKEAWTSGDAGVKLHNAIWVRTDP